MEMASLCFREKGEDESKREREREVRFSNEGG